FTHTLAHSVCPSIRLVLSLPINCSNGKAGERRLLLRRLRKGWTIRLSSRHRLRDGLPSCAGGAALQNDGQAFCLSSTGEIQRSRRAWTSPRLISLSISCRPPR